MTDPFQAVEERLIAGYCAQLVYYDRALDIAAQPTLDSARADESVNELNTVLRDIAALDAAIAEDKAVWRFSGRQPGARMRELLEKVAERIRALAGIVDRRFAELQASKHALMPQVDESIRQRRMLSAYGKSS